MKNLDKLLSWLQTSEYDGVILGRRDNFKWITEENANAVVTNTEVGVAHLLIEKDGSVTVAADSSDCPRMETEQNALRAKGMLIPWYESFEAHLKDYIGDRTFASDTGIAGTDNVQSELIDVRMQLSEKELKRYRKIGQECAGIVEGVAMNARPGQTEQEIADKIRTGCIARGISPDCVLVGSDERRYELSGVFSESAGIICKRRMPGGMEDAPSGRTDRIWLQGIYSNTRDERCN